MNIAVLVDATKSVVIIAYGRSGGIAVDVCDGGAKLERRFSNARYGGGDGYGGEGGAISVSVYYCVPAPCILKGRKNDGT